MAIPARRQRPVRSSVTDCVHAVYCDARKHWLIWCEHFSFWYMWPGLAPVRNLPDALLRSAVERVWSGLRCVNQHHGHAPPPLEHGWQLVRHLPQDEVRVFKVPRV